MNESHHKWNNIEWLEQAKVLIENLMHFPSDQKIIIIIRHSERELLSSLKKNSDLQLTSTGFLVSRLFGQNLPRNRRIRLFHSDRDRCRDTAHEILNGFREIGGIGTICGNLEPLFTFKFKKGFFKERFKSDSLLEIINKWIVGYYSPEDIESLPDYCQYAASIIWSKLNEISPGDIDIHVTHESLLMFLRTGWFGLDPNKKWPNFLGGFAFSLRKDTFYLLDFDELVEIPYPFWKYKLEL
jgi:hypothetical protein